MAEHYSDPDRIHRYVYQGLNHSLIDHLLKFWWQLAIKAIPARASANAVSMIGNLGSWTTVLILVFFGASHGPHRPWIFGVATLGIVFYHTMDCLDGIQARRSGSSGPLGEFIDHWFDSFNIFFFPLGMAAAFPVIPPWLAVAMVMVALVADWVSLREVTDTNVLYFPPLSSEEAITGYWIFNLLVWVTGYAFWARPLPVIGVAPVVINAYIGLIGLSVTIITVWVRLRGIGIREVLWEMVAVAPLVAWIAVMHARTGTRWTLIAGLTVIGFTGSRFIGDLLRARLFGLHYPVRYQDNLLCGALVWTALVLYVVVPATPLWVPIGALIVYFVDTVVALVLQFVRSLRRVRERLGITLFTPFARTAGGAKPV